MPGCRQIDSEQTRELGVEGHVAELQLLLRPMAELKVNRKPTPSPPTKKKKKKERKAFSVKRARLLV